MSSAADENDEEAIALRCAAVLADGGTTAAWAREHAEGEPFYLRVADELAALEAAAEARTRLRVVDGDGERRNPLTRRWVIADKRAESPLALVAVPAGRQDRYRG